MNQISHSVDVLFNLGKPEIQYSNHREDIISLASRQCKTLRCIKLLENLTDQYFSFLDQYKETTIEVPGVIEAVKVKKFTLYHYHEKWLKIGLTASTQEAVLTVTEALIRAKAREAARP